MAEPKPKKRPTVTYEDNEGRTREAPLEPTFWESTKEAFRPQGEGIRINQQRERAQQRKKRSL